MRRQLRLEGVVLGRRRSGRRGGTTKITLWHGYGELAAAGEEPNTEHDSMKAQVDAFKAANPNIKVT